jgi:hypothetical protein
MKGLNNCNTCLSCANLITLLVTVVIVSTAGCSKKEAQGPGPRPGLIFETRSRGVTIDLQESCFKASLLLYGEPETRGPLLIWRCHLDYQEEPMLHYVENKWYVKFDSTRIEVSDEAVLYFNNAEKEVQVLADGWDERCFGDRIYFREYVAKLLRSSGVIKSVQPEQ